MKIIKNGVETWSNLHQTFSQQVMDVWDLVNETSGTPLQNYNDTTKGILSIIANAMQKGTPLKALGGSWSLSPIAATPGIILNTRPLNTVFTIGSDSVSADYTGDANKLVLAQCGTGIWELNDFLHGRGLSLSACGASNGQTIAGGVATGTHGAAIGFGGIQESIVGLHLITGKDKHIWLERASYPVVDNSFPDRLGATLVRDDEAFNAALVSFGSFGFVLGMMVQAEKEYLLEAYLRKVPYDDAFFHQVTTLDFAHPNLPFVGVTPFHFQSLINPYDLGHGVYMTTMYKRPYKPDYNPPKPNGDGVGPGDDAPCFIGKVAGVVPALVPTLVTKVLASSLTPYEKQLGRLGEIFNNTTLRGKVASAAYGLSPKDVGNVIKALLDVNKTAGPFAGLFAFRFVKASKATMAFTRFTPVTCVLELDGVLSHQTIAFYEAVCNELEKRGIPFTYHWGKMNLLNPTRIRRMYGDSFDRFLAARKRIVDADLRQLFSNDTTRQWGIEAPLQNSPANSPAV